MTSRPLGYRLRLAAQNAGQSGGRLAASPVLFWPDGLPEDEPIPVTVMMSKADFRQWCSSIDVGADIAYPDEYIRILDRWMTSMTIDLCSLVAQCVDTSDSVQRAVNNVSITQNIQPDENVIEQRLYDGSPTAPEIAPPPQPDPCDLDALWAGIRSMVTRLDANGRDLFEQLNAINDVVERFEELINAVPVLGGVAIALTKQLTQIAPDLLTAYNAFSDPAELDTFACDLFDLACAECRYPTWDEVWDIIETRSALSGAPLLQVTSTSIVQALIDANGDATEVVWYSVQALQLYILANDLPFVRGYGANSLNVWASFGEDLPNDNWRILCSACTGVLRRYGGNGDADITYLQGTYDAAFDQALSDPSANSPGFAFLEFTWAFAEPITGSVTLDYLWQATRTGTSNWGSIQVFDQSNQIDSALLTANGSTGSQRGFNLANATQLRVFMNVRAQNAGDSTFGAINGIEITLA